MTAATTREDTARLLAYLALAGGTDLQRLARSYLAALDLLTRWQAEFHRRFPAEVDGGTELSVICDATHEFLEGN
jgi:hypothetical protein